MNRSVEASSVKAIRRVHLIKLLFIFWQYYRTKILHNGQASKFHTTSQGVFVRSPRMNLQGCTVPQPPARATVWGKKLLSLVVSVLSGGFRRCFSHSLFAFLRTSCVNSTLPCLCRCAANLTLSLLPFFLSLSVLLCACRSVCLFTLTLSSLLSQHCSSWLPESQTPWLISHSSPLSPT